MRSCVLRSTSRSSTQPGACLDWRSFSFSFLFSSIRLLRTFTTSHGTQFRISSRLHGCTRHLESGGLCGDLDLSGQGYSRVTSLGDLSLYISSHMVDKIRYEWGQKGLLHTNKSSFPTFIFFLPAYGSVSSPLQALKPRAAESSRVARYARSRSS